MSRVSCAELNFAKNSKAVNVIDLHGCRCQNSHKRALHYALVSSLDMRVVVPRMNILLGRAVANKFIECNGKVPSAEQSMLKVTQIIVGYNFVKIKFIIV
jgi:hypothetical protein